MVPAGGSRSAAPSSTKQLSEVGPPSLPGRRLPRVARGACQKPLRADEPVIQDSEFDPQRESSVGKAKHRRIRDLRVIGATSRYCVGSVRLHSVVGPHRLGGGFRWLVLIRSPARGPIQSRRGRACAAVRRVPGSWSQRLSQDRGRRGAPVRPAAPRTGPESLRSHQVPFMSSFFARGLVDCALSR